MTIAPFTYPPAAAPSDADTACDAVFNFDDPAVARFVSDAIAGATTQNEQVIALYNAVRDQIRYTPYNVSVDPLKIRASAVLAEPATYCIPKAILYIAALRSLGIPARVGYADVRNHLASPKLLAALRSELFVAHGYAAIFLNGRWVRATPTFNRELCERVGTDVLDFDGVNDALFHPFDAAGNQHMEYVRYHGEFSSIDAEFLVKLWREEYPHWFAPSGDVDVAGAEDSLSALGASLEREAEDPVFRPQPDQT